MKTTSHWPFISACLFLCTARISGFSPISHTRPLIPSLSSSKSLLQAKKKSSSSATGKGFAKAPTPEPSSPSTESKKSQESPTSFGLNSIPTPSTTTPSSSSSSSEPIQKIDVDPNLPTEERTKQILKQKYGLRTFEEQQDDIKSAQAIAENSKRMKKIKEMKDEEFDLFMVIPPDVIKAIDLFLKVGVGVSTVLFVLAGVGITLEAGSISMGKPLPEDLDHFITDVIEPNFTPGLLVLLSFSVSLGIFASAQLGSGASQYKEK